MQRRKGNSQGFKPPVEVGEEIDVVIEAVGEKGDGIARKSGFVIFIPNAKEGETVRIKITKVLQKVGFGEVVGEAKSTPVVEEKPVRHKVTQDDLVEEEPSRHFEDTEDFGDESEDSEDKEETSDKKDMNDDEDDDSEEDLSDEEFDEDSEERVEE